MKERRGYIRVNEAFNINYQVISPPDGGGISGTTNVSKGGISFPTDRLLVPGIILKLKIDLLKGGEPIDATGEVVWVKETDGEKFPYMIGIRFVRIELHNQDRIFHLINKKAQENESPDVK